MAIENQLDDFISEATFSPEGPVQNRIARFDILSRLQVLDEISEADFELDAA